MYMYCIAGNIQGFTDTYLEAIKLQRQAQRSISMESMDGDQLNLPYEIFLDIFGYLSARDVCAAMRVCKVCLSVVHVKNALILSIPELV